MTSMTSSLAFEDCEFFVKEGFCGSKTSTKKRKCRRRHSELARLTTVVCDSWVRAHGTRQCELGDSCRFRHPRIVTPSDEPLLKCGLTRSDVAAQFRQSIAVPCVVLRYCGLSRYCRSVDELADSLVFYARQIVAERVICMHRAASPDALLDVCLRREDGVEREWLAARHRIFALYAADGFASPQHYLAAASEPAVALYERHRARLEAAVARDSAAWSYEDDVAVYSYAAAIVNFRVAQHHSLDYDLRCVLTHLRPEKMLGDFVVDVIDCASTLLPIEKTPLVLVHCSPDDTIEVCVREQNPWRFESFARVFGVLQ